MNEIETNFYTSLIDKFLKNELSDFEVKLLFEWVDENEDNKKFFIDTKKLIDISNSDYIDFNVDKDAAWEKVKPQLNNSSGIFSGNAL